MRYLLVSLFMLLFLYNGNIISSDEVIEGNPTTRSTTSYYWWKQDSARYLRSETVDSSWLNQGGTIKLNGTQSYSKTINATSPTVSASISFSFVGISGGISVSSSGSYSVSTSMTQTLSQGTYQPLYKKRRDIYEVKQSKYYYEFGRSRLVSKKTRSIKFSAHAEWRFHKK